MEDVDVATKIRAVVKVNFCSWNVCIGINAIIKKTPQKSRELRLIDIICEAFNGARITPF